MSSIATTWAWSQADLNSSAKIVLLALADHADENYSCYPSVARIMELTNLSERTVRNVISDLAANGFIKIEHRHRDNGTQASSRYWLQIQPANSAPCQPATDAPGDKVQGANSAPLEVKTTNNKPTSKSKTTSFARTIARAKPASDEDLTDPAKAVWGNEGGADAPEPRPRAGRSKLKTRALSAGGNLARDFASRARRARPDTPGDTNQGALSGQFNRWMKEDDLDAGVIRGMMDTYFSDERLWDAYRPMWVDFLNKRARLASEGKKEAQLREDQANRHNADYWTEVTTEDEHRHDAAYWESV